MNSSSTNVNFVGLQIDFLKPQAEKLISNFMLKRENQA